jgi:hypothetical protein
MSARLDPGLIRARAEISRSVPAATLARYRMLGKIEDAVYVSYAPKREEGAGLADPRALRTPTALNGSPAQ